MMLRGNGGVKEVVGRTRVNEGVDQGSQKKIRSKRDHKGVQIVKSRCIESWLHRCTSEFNTVLSQCRDKRTAHRFFDSMLDLALEVLSVMVAEQPLAAEEVTFQQSFTTCLPFPQKRHRFWSKQRWCFC